MVTYEEALKLTIEGDAVFFGGLRIFNRGRKCK